GAIIVVDAVRAQTDPANSIVANIPAGCSPVRLAISPSGDRVYVTARNSNSLLAFDANALRSNTEHALVGKVPVGSSPVGVAVVNDGKLVVVTNSNRFAKDQTARQTLTVIDAGRVNEGQAAITGSVPAGIFPREFGQSQDGRTLFVANYLSNELEVIDLDRIGAASSPTPQGQVSPDQQEMTFDAVIKGARLIDADSDGIANGEDNCPAVANADQKDTD